MVEADSIPQHLLENARASISKHLNKLALLVGGPSQMEGISLGESFSVWTLAPAFGDRTAGEDLFTQIGYWQQIYVEERATAFARIALADKDLALEMIGVIDVVPAIDAAIRWIDDNVSGDYVARLVIVPFAHAHLFWLHGEENRIVPIDRAIGTLQPLTSYSLDEFVAVTAEQLRHASTERAS